MTAEDEIADMRAVYEPLAESVRRLIDVSIRTEVDAATVAAAKAKIDCSAEELRFAHAWIIRGAADRRRSKHGLGQHRDRCAKPRRTPTDRSPPRSGSVWADFELGAAYERPAGNVRGGVCALILDHVLGVTRASQDVPALSRPLTLRYVRGTPLGELHARARVVRVDGVKTFAVGHIADAEGVTVEAEGGVHPPSRSHDVEIRPAVEPH